MDTEAENAILRETLSSELEALWGDLNDALHRVVRGGWSIGGWSAEAEGIRDRILTISHVIGPIDPTLVQIPRLLDGTYDAVHVHGGIVPPKWDRARMQALWDSFEASPSGKPGTVTPLRR